jgi:outer membrane beta-barrel protein
MAPNLAKTLLLFALLGASAWADTPYANAPSPNVSMHVVQRRQFQDEGTSELVVYPAIVQLNGEYSQSYGTGLLYAFHVRERFALELQGIYNWSARDSSFNRELNSAVSAEARASSSLLLRYGATAGAEVAPIYGKFAIYDGFLARFSIVLHAGIGAAATQHELEEGSAYAPTTYGDTGAKLLLSAGAGFRFQVGSRFTLRLEVNDLAYTGKVDRVNGCNSQDLATLLSQQAAGQPLGPGVSGSCQVSRFQGTHEADLRTAQTLTTDNSSDVLNNVGFYAGFGVVF